MSGYFRDPNGTEGGHLRLQAFDGKNLVVGGGDWLFSFCRLLVSTVLCTWWWHSFHREDTLRERDLSSSIVFQVRDWSTAPNDLGRESRVLDRGAPCSAKRRGNAHGT